MDKDTIRYIISKLREASVTWSGRSECLKRYSKQVQEGFYKNGKAKFKLHYRCGLCDKWFRDVKQMEVDHIVEIGPFKGDWTEYIGRMFCSQDNLMSVCIACHLKKTSSNASLRYQRK